MIISVGTKHGDPSSSPGPDCLNSCGIEMVCLFGFYGISTFVGYLMPNPF